MYFNRYNSLNFKVHLFKWTRRRVLNIYLIIYLVWPHQFGRNRCDRDLADINPWKSPSRLYVFFPKLFENLWQSFNQRRLETTCSICLQLFLIRNIYWYQAYSCFFVIFHHDSPLVLLSTLRSKKVCKVTSVNLTEWRINLCATFSSTLLTFQ